MLLILIIFIFVDCYPVEQSRGICFFQREWTWINFREKVFLLGQRPRLKERNPKITHRIFNRGRHRLYCLDGIWRCNKIQSRNWGVECLGRGVLYLSPVFPCMVCWYI